MQTVRRFGDLTTSLSEGPKFVSVFLSLVNVNGPLDWQMLNFFSPAAFASADNSQAFQLHRGGIRGSHGGCSPRAINWLA